ncbi:hypothetical protein NHX12_017785 [Muraenolepis orangiensis]|uniref:Uncharacterized protein n=1 Tax=Muraenolepis orangiensis TaxID=630683 RepID=A0A9Q0EYE8_9TELE|nr:hypothetical protein NHX12_017785 [Muraenolepis orangiensis]
MAGSGAAMRLYEFRERQNASTTEPRTPRVTRAGRDVRGLYPGELGRVHLHLSNCSGSHQDRRSTSHRSEKVEEVYQRSFDLLVIHSLEVQRHLQAPPQRPETSYQHHYSQPAPTTVLPGPSTEPDHVHYPPLIHY